MILVEKILYSIFEPFHGNCDFLIYEELESMQTNPSFGKKQLQDPKYHEIFKSECLKTYGLEEGLKVYEEALIFTKYKVNRVKTPGQKQAKEL